LKNKLIAIGYWKSLYETEFPDPAKFEDIKWNSKEKAGIIEHLKKGKSIANWMGTSWCRFRCREKNMGNSCLTDGIFLFPEKLTHYIEEHNVRLPNEFINHVLNYKKTEILNDITEYEIDYTWWKEQKGFNFNESKKSFLALTDEEIEKFENRKNCY
jgi:hypothetical protein